MISQWVDTVCAQTPQSSEASALCRWACVHWGGCLKIRPFLHLLQHLFSLGIFVCVRVCVFSKCLCAACGQPGLCELVGLSLLSAANVWKTQPEICLSQSCCEPQAILLTLSEDPASPENISECELPATPSQVSPFHRWQCSCWPPWPVLLWLVLYNKEAAEVRRIPSTRRSQTPTLLIQSLAVFQG